MSQLIAIGKDLGADEVTILRALEEYLKEPEDWNFAYQQKKLACEALDLPERAVNSPFTVGDLVEFGEELQSVGSGMEVLQDPKTWQLIELRGRGGSVEKEQIVTEVWGRQAGIPESVVPMLTRDQLVSALVGVQQRGLEFAITHPEFWEHFLSSPNKEGAYQWARGEQAAQDKQRAADLNRRIAAFNRAAAKGEREREELRRLREEDRQKRAAEKARRRRKKRRWQRGRVSTIPSEISIAITRQVATPWGSNYLLRVYEDETSEMFRINDDGSLKCVLKLGHHAYEVSQTPGGMLHVIPVIGRRTTRRPASPLDRTEGQRRGPLGMDQ